MPGAAAVAPGRRHHLADHAFALLVVDGDHAAHHREVVAVLGGDAHQRPRVLREATAAPSGAGAQEGTPDALVGADALDHVMDVGADRLAECGDGVDERDLHRQESVGGVLDRLRRCGVGDQDLRVEVVIERRHTLGGSRVVAADHDAIGVEEVVDRGALAEELRVGHDRHVGALQHPLDHPRRTDRHGRLVDHHRPRSQDRRDLTRCRLDVGEVGAAVLVLRRGHAQEHDVGVRRRARGADHEPQAPGGDGVGDELVEPVLDDRDLPRFEPCHLVLVDVGADDVEPEMGEARAGREPDIPGADHGKRRSAALVGGVVRRFAGCGHRPNATNATALRRRIGPAPDAHPHAKMTA